MTPLYIYDVPSARNQWTLIAYAHVAHRSEIATALARWYSEPGRGATVAYYAPGETMTLNNWAFYSGNGRVPM